MQFWNIPGFLEQFDILRTCRLVRIGEHCYLLYKYVLSYTVELTSYRYKMAITRALISELSTTMICSPMLVWSNLLLRHCDNDMKVVRIFDFPIRENDHSREYACSGDIINPAALLLLNSRLLSGIKPWVGILEELLKYNLKGQCHEMVVEVRPWSGSLALN
jgi:hypothetical protein